MAYCLILLENTDLQLLYARAPPPLMECASVSATARHCRGSASAFCHSEGIEAVALGFVNRDYFYRTPDLHSGKLFGRLRGRRDRKEEGEQGSQNKTLQEAIITMWKKRINSHLLCINGC